MSTAKAVRVDGATKDELEVHPFWPVLKWLFTALGAVNPSRVNELLDAVEGAIFVLVASDEWICHVDLETHEIRVSTGVVEATWAAAYAYYTTYKQIEGSAGGDLSNAVAMGPPAAALEVFRWALGRGRGERCAWPTDFPLPEDPSLGQTTSRGVASEMSLVAVSALLLHEIGHHSQRHRVGAPQVESLQMERDADNFAVDWMLADKGEREGAREKMRFGIVIAFGWMVARETIAWRRGTLKTFDDEGDEKDKRRHPWSYSRLFDSIDRTGADPHSTSWCIAVAVLALHASHVGLAIPTGPFEDCRAAADALVDLLAEHVK